ncbi:hypothetical protein ACFX50_01050 [Neisseria meningitidis]
MTNPSIRKPASRHSYEPTFRHSHEPASRHSHESGNLVLSVRKLIGYSGLTKIRTRRRSRRQYR